MKAKQPGLTLLLWGGALLMAFPFWVMLATSLMDAQQVFAGDAGFWPKAFRWQNYLDVLTQLSMGRYFVNSLLVSIVTTGVHVFLCALAGYGFARFRFPGQNALFLLFILTLMVPPQINLVPLFFLMKQLGWLDTYAALIVPGLFGAFGVFMLRQWFLGFPKELEEAAVMDGCNPWQTFCHIALPLAVPALAALAIFVFIGSWNSFMWPLVAVNSESMRTLPVGMAALKSSFRDTTHWELLMAASAMSLLPVIGLFLAGQRQFIQGIMAGAVKE